MAEPTKEKETTIASKKKGSHKWLGRFGKFLMYGGWLLIVIVVVVIAITISTC